jgi:hypothetical protein
MLACRDDLPVNARHRMAHGAPSGARAGHRSLNARRKKPVIGSTRKPSAVRSPVFT